MTLEEFVARGVRAQAAVDAVIAQATKGGRVAYAAKTEVPVMRTRSEIEQLLERHKARQYGTAVDYELLSARVHFRLHDRIVRFVVALPDKKKLGDGSRFAQAERQRWRGLLLVIKAKLESVESGIETFEQAFLGQVVMPNDQTVADIIQPLIAEGYKSGRMPRLLSAPADNEGKR